MHLFSQIMLLCYQLLLNKSIQYELGHPLQKSLTQKVFLHNGIHVLRLFHVVKGARCNAGDIPCNKPWNIASRLPAGPPFSGRRQQIGIAIIFQILVKSGIPKGTKELHGIQETENRLFHVLPVGLVQIVFKRFIL